MEDGRWKDLKEEDGDRKKESISSNLFTDADFLMRQVPEEEE